MDEKVREILIQFGEPFDECCGAYCEDAGCCPFEKE